VINVTKRINFHHQRLVIFLDFASPEIAESITLPLEGYARSGQSDDYWFTSRLKIGATISEMLFRPLRTALAADNDAWKHCFWPPITLSFRLIIMQASAIVLWACTKETRHGIRTSNDMIMEWI
jgi:hypothetical protein